MNKCVSVSLIALSLAFWAAWSAGAAEPRPDPFQPLPPGAIQLHGPLDALIRRPVATCYNDKTLAAMVDVFRKRRNAFAEGEFWGKCVRALCHHLQYTSDPALRTILDATLADLISTQTSDGAISGYARDKQPYDTDLWDRKYVLLGLLHGYEVTRDPKVLEAAKRMADHLLTQVGPPPKVRVYDTHYGSKPNFPAKPTLREICFAGLESSSILEPMVRLYQVTGEPRYREFCRYLVEVEGGSMRGSIFEAALKGQDAKDFGGDGNPNHSVAHAYCVISCFEGLIEYFRATGEPRWKDAAWKLFENVVAKETAIIGSSCGLGGVNNGIAPTEQFNHTAFHQTCPVRDGLEGCTHARWMTYCRHLLRATGDSRFADQYERTLYNAFLGSIRPDALAVDYHTQLNGTRPAKINYHKIFNGQDFTCCYFNVIDALAMIPATAVMSGAGGPVVNLYIPSTARVPLADGNSVRLEQTTDYPRTGDIAIRVCPDRPARFPIRVRIPEWSQHTTVKVNGETVAARPGSYLTLEREWQPGDTITLALDLRCRLVRPPEGTPDDAKAFQALVRGPIVLARDKRLGGDLYEELEIQADAEGFVNLTPMSPAISARMQFAVPRVGGGQFPVIDFESSGNTWDARSERVTWIPRPEPAATRWIWYPEGENPAIHAPVGKRWFRRQIALPAGREIQKAVATLTADNAFTLYVNGRKAGAGDAWQKPVTIDLRSSLSPGTTLVLAVEASNTEYKGPNAAGLLVRVRIDFISGPPLVVGTDRMWKASSKEMAGWQEPGFADEAWVPARVLGRHGMKPWGLLKEFSGER